MSVISKQEQLRQLLDQQQECIRSTFPIDKGSVLVALTCAQDWSHLKAQDALTPAIAGTGVSPYLYTSGWYKALQWCFAAPAPSSNSPAIIDSTLDSWADKVLAECDALAEAEQVLAHCETGFMSMQQSGQKDFFAWVASKKVPTEWRVREDIAWWTNALARAYEHEKQELAAERVSIQQRLDEFARQWQADMPVYYTTRVIDDYYKRLGMVRVKIMACHFLYPAQTLIGGCTVELYRTVLAILIGWALRHLDICRAFVAQHPAYTLRVLLALPHNTVFLVKALSETLGVDEATVLRVLDAYTLRHENVLYHCSVANTPVPPLLKVEDQQLVWSLTGLLSEPLFFLSRELRRRYSHEYHTAAHLHEEVFRQDLYRLFSDDRFVKSAGSVKLKGVQGDWTTDIDALIFDRKTGALALFELKSQDPFAYSRQERIRQRDYFYNAGKQIVACVQWINRNGANALLTRLDSRLVKRLKAHKTYIFVLGRYLAHFFDGPEFDRRAAWGTWPQVLQLVNETPFEAEDTDPIQSLHNKLMKDTPRISSAAVAVRKIAIGERNVYVYPDFEAYKNQVGQA